MKEPGICAGLLLGASGQTNARGQNLLIGPYQMVEGRDQTRWYREKMRAPNWERDPHQCRNSRRNGCSAMTCRYLGHRACKVTEAGQKGPPLFYSQKGPARPASVTLRILLVPDFLHWHAGYLSDEALPDFSTLFVAFFAKGMGLTSCNLFRLFAVPRTAGACVNLNGFIGANLHRDNSL